MNISKGLKWTFYWTGRIGNNIIDKIEEKLLIKFGFDLDEDELIEM
jgi:hypothetical protein